MKYVPLLLTLLLSLVSSELQAQNVQPQDQNIQPYETYLNDLKSFSGEFVQINSKGHKAKGTVCLSRPGKMRLDYHPPSSLLIVSNGKWLVTYDKESDEPNYVSLENTPAAFILRPHISFTEGVTVTNIIRGAETTRISLVRQDEPDAGTLSLVFTHSPICLKEWSVVDAQGVETRVAISNLKPNVSLSPELFVIKDPDLIQQIF